MSRDEPEDEIELLHDLFTGRRSFADVDEVNSRPDPGVELRFDAPNGGVVYLQCVPFALQVYDGNPMDDDVSMFDGGWDEIQDLVPEDRAPWRLDQDELRAFVDERRVDE